MIKSLVPVLSAALLGAATLMPSALVAQTAAPDGAMLFRQRCQSCHSVVRGAPAAVGPNLNGVVGRKAAATTFAYSSALKNSKLTWTRANLDRFLTAPARMVPGSRMVIALPDTAQRNAVLDFLQRNR